MSTSDLRRFWVGADPGGQGNFGVATISHDGSARAYCVDCADKAVELVLRQCDAECGGIGVDAPLWWSSGRSSDRKADQWLREKYKLSGGQVQTANSLRGAALVQGVMFVQRMREHFPAIGVTETHPKALLRALKSIAPGQFLSQFNVAVGDVSGREHERDALISAVAAREGFEGRWLHDLSDLRGPSEQDPSQFWLAPIHYFWPEN